MYTIMLFKTTVLYVLATALLPMQNSPVPSKQICKLVVQSFGYANTTVTPAT